MSETKSDEKNGKQTDKDIDKLEKQAKGFKKGTIGLGVLGVGAAVGAILTFALGGPVVLGVILIIAEFGFGSGAAGCAGRYRGIQKSIEVVKKKEGIKNQVEEKLKSKEKEVGEKMIEEEKKNEQLKKEKENLQKENNNLNNQLNEALNINFEKANTTGQTSSLNNGHNVGLNGLNNIGYQQTNQYNSGVNTISEKTNEQQLKDFM